MAYDIFISYRRDGGENLARDIKSELEKCNYSVFFDFNSLYGLDWVARIDEAIKESKVVIFVYSSGALDRCKNEEDMVRHELELAYDEHKIVIPVSVDKAFKEDKGFPDACPTKIRNCLGAHTFAEVITGQHQTLTIRRLIDEIIDKEFEKSGWTKEKALNSIVKIRANADCRVEDCGDLLCELKANKWEKISILPGDYVLEIISNENPNVCQEIEFEVNPGKSHILRIELPLEDISQPQEESEPQSVKKVFPIEADMDCLLKCCGHLLCHLKCGWNDVTLPLGIHILECVSAENTADKLEFEVDTEKKNFLRVKLQPIRDVRIKKERKKEAEARRRAEEEAERIRQEREEQARKACEEAARLEAQKQKDAESREVIQQLLDNMIVVEGGTFMMGATSEQGGDVSKDERPVHKVTLSSYKIGKYPVTQVQWQKVMGNNPSSDKYDVNCPVEGVSWDDSMEFIKRLNQLSGMNFRLPTEAEWEFAARGGNQSQHYKYSGSNNIEEVAWYSDNAGGTTHPVGQKNPNELGLYDMSGNVLEWCQDWFGDYPSCKETNPRGSVSGWYRVLRGGCWDYDARECRLSSRIEGRDSFGCFFGTGLRLVCDSVKKVNKDKSYKVGDSYNKNGKEGIVFYVDESGEHGKIVSLQVTEKPWAVNNGLLFNIFNPSDKRIGADSRTDGIANMQVIQTVKDWQKKYPAFAWCASLGEGWYLPAIWELDLLLLNDDVRNVVSKTLVEKGGTRLYSKEERADYWSSTEYSSGCARIVCMYDGDTTSNFKNNNYYVRAVSAF